MAHASFSGSCLRVINNPPAILTVHFSEYTVRISPQTNLTTGRPNKKKNNIIQINSQNTRETKNKIAEHVMNKW